MQIYGPSHLHGPQSIGTPHGPQANQPTRPAAESTQITDEIQISDIARLMEEARQLPEIRLERVNAIRAQIADGTYETEGKLDAAVDRLLDEIG